MFLTLFTARCLKTATEGPLASAPVLPGPAADHNGEDDDSVDDDRNAGTMVLDSTPDHTGPTRKTTTEY